MSSRTPAEDENSTAHTPHYVMLSASEASAFQFRNKADSSAEFILSVTKGLRMTFKDRHVEGPHFSKELANNNGLIKSRARDSFSLTRRFRGLRSFREGVIVFLRA